MLVLSRKVGEQIQIGDHIVVTVVRLAGGLVRLGVQAPDNARIVRRELDAPAPCAEKSPSNADSAPSKGPAPDEARPTNLPQIRF